MPLRRTLNLLCIKNARSNRMILATACVPSSVCEPVLNHLYDSSRLKIVAPAASRTEEGEERRDNIYLRSESLRL